MISYKTAGKVRMILKGVFDPTAYYETLDMVSNSDHTVLYMARVPVGPGSSLDDNEKWGRVIDISAMPDRLSAAENSVDTILGITSSLHNDITNVESDINALAGNIDNDFATMNIALSNKIDGAYVEEGYLYMTSDGEVVVGPLGPFSGGGGGGGGGSYSYKITLSPIGSRQISTSADSTVNIQFNYTSVDEGNVDDGAGIGTIYINNIAKRTFSVQQGVNTVDITNLVNNGTNNVRLKVENSESSSKTTTWTVTIITLNVTTTFNPIDTYTGDVLFNYTVNGSGAKTVVFVMDGTEIGRETVTTSGYARVYNIPEQSYGAHTLTVYAFTTIDDVTIESNSVVLSMIWASAGSIIPIIGSTYTGGSVMQGDIVTIPYTVFDPLHEIATVNLIVLDSNNSVYSTLTITQNRNATSWIVNDYPAGNITFRIDCRGTYLDINMSVTEFVFPLSVTTDSLKLAFSANGRSNAEANPASWSYTDEDDNTYTATFDGFGWTNADGWVNDSSNAAVLRFLPGDTMTIPFYPFTRDARETGYTIEVDLATRDVRDYESIVMSCLSGEINGVGGIGFKIQTQEANLRTQGLPDGISMLFKEDSRVHITFSIEPRNSSRIIYIYINGIMCGAIQYGTNDNIQQINPVGLTIGAESCGLDLYKIRCYNRDLDRNEQLNNFIVDKSTLDERQNSYNFNNILDTSTQDISLIKLPQSLPYMIIKSVRMPQFKGDKLTADITFVDPLDNSKNFTANGSQIDVQGTSSAGYPVKNSKIKLKNIVINGEDSSTYSIRSGEHGVKTLCTKVDYASSEGANNVELVQLYELICREQGYLTPPQRENSLVRQGISGRPIVIFWQNSDTNEVTFYGKANMNWDKGNPDAFGFTDYPNAECWEFKNNTSFHCLFKNGNMSGWENDFEARYPEDYTDVTNLGKVLSWVASTDTTAATNASLSESVTYNGVTYTTDSAEYRLAKFKNEFTDWFYKDLAIFYYVFTQTFLMVDSRAKNMFITTYDGNKWIASLPYDMDTALGINNEGELKFEYNLEDTDTINGSNVFNGQLSVLWNNVREAFGSDIVDMYKTLRTRSSYFNYEYVKNMFEQHQSVWPERLWNEDAFKKYLQPFLQEGEDNLAMLQGSKESQRDWWLFNTFRYWDSKYETGDAETNFITLRTYSSGDIELVPYSHIYARLKYGSYNVKQRAERNELITLECPFSSAESANDTETYLYSADRIAQIGDLSPLQVGYAIFSDAIKLQTLKLGDGSNQYVNEHLNRLIVGNNELLTNLDIRNCPNLNTNIDLSGCTGIEKIYAKGSGITGVTLPNGGHLDTLELPNTVTNLTILNQKLLSDFSIEGSSYLQTLYIENTPNIPFEDIITDAAESLAYVRLIGAEWTATDETALQNVIDILEGCRGQDASGNNIDHAVVEGTVHIDELSNELLTEISENFPNLVVIVNNIPQYVVTFVNYDGTVLYRQIVQAGGNAYNPVSLGLIETPTRPVDPSGEHGYIYNGWGTLPTNIQENKTITVRYTDRWRVRYLNYDEETVLYSVLVTNGGNAQYSGATPTKPSDAEYSYVFSEWIGNQNRILQPTDVVAGYTPVDRIYVVKFYNGSTLVKTYNNLNYEDVLDYTLAQIGTPVHPSEPETYDFKEWKTNDDIVYAPGMLVRADYIFYAQWLDVSTPLLQYLRGTLTDYVSGPNLEKITQYSFYGLSSLQTVTASTAEIEAYAFQNCTNLNKITLTNQVTIDAYAFSSRNKLDTLILNNMEISNLSNINAFDNTAIEAHLGGIYVPDELVNYYKEATNWSTFANQIYSINDYKVEDYSTIKDDWDTIILNINNGDAESFYSVGDTKSLLDINGNLIGYMQLAGFNKDILADSEVSTASTTWLLLHSYGTSKFNSTSDLECNWENSSIRNQLQNNTNGIITILPSNIQNAIKIVKKSYYNGTEENICNDTLWLPSYRELMMSATGYETSGPQYSELFGSNTSTSSRRARKRYALNGSAITYITRTTYIYSSTNSSGVTSQTIYNRLITSEGSSSSYGGITSGYNFIFGFCI